MGNVEIFDAIADQYDTAERIAMTKIISDTIRGQVAAASDKSAIDYGCGTGLVGLELLDVFGSMLFVDASESMIERVRQKLGLLQDKTCKIQAQSMCCDFMTECPADLKTDYIIMVNVLIHERKIEALLARLYSILNKGGHLIIVDFDKNEGVVSNEVHNGFDQLELTHILRKTSFSGIDSRTFYHGKKNFMNQDASLFIIDAVI